MTRRRVRRGDARNLPQLDLVAGRGGRSGGLGRHAQSATPGRSFYWRVGSWASLSGGVTRRHMTRRMGRLEPEGDGAAVHDTGAANRCAISECLECHGRSLAVYADHAPRFGRRTREGKRTKVGDRLRPRGAGRRRPAGQGDARGGGRDARGGRTGSWRSAGFRSGTSASLPPGVPVCLRRSWNSIAPGARLPCARFPSPA